MTQVEDRRLADSPTSCRTQAMPTDACRVPVRLWRGDRRSGDLRYRRMQLALLSILNLSSFLLPFSFPLLPYPLTAHLTSSPSFGGLPCISRPTRKMRPAAQTKARVQRAMPRRPHPGLPGGDAGGGGLAEQHQHRGEGRDQRGIQVENPLSGSFITGNQTKFGITTSIHTGVIIACASLRSLQAEPTARNRAPNMRTAARA